MNNKILGKAALMSLMAATAAKADVTIGGTFNGLWADGDSYVSQERVSITESAAITYTDTLDNGIGIEGTMAFESGAANASGNGDFDISFISDMGTVSFGNGLSGGPVDSMDSHPVKSSFASSRKLPQGLSADYEDGDGVSGAAGFDNNNQIVYTSPKINGFTAKAGIGFGTSAGHGDIMAYSISGKIAGFSVKGGIVDEGNTDSRTGDENYMIGIKAPKLAGFTIGYGLYDSDSGDSYTVVGVKTPKIPGLGATFQYEYFDVDNTGSTADDDGSIASLQRSFGGGVKASLEYHVASVGSNADVENFFIGYKIGF
jgi:hypothetical protein